MPPDFNDILARFFVQPNDPIMAQDDEQTRKALRVPDTSAGNTVDYLIDGHEYFGALRKEVAALRAGAGERFFYFANWYAGLTPVDPRDPQHIDGKISAWDTSVNLDAFKLDDGQPGTTFLKDDLAQLAQQGVEVRALVWINPLLFTSKLAAQAGGVLSVNLHSMTSITDLRERPEFVAQDGHKKLILNTLSHPIGAMHLKVALCGDANGLRAYVSGLDFVSNRVAGRDHSGGQFWHDAGVRIQGPAALAVYNYYRLLYNEQLGRDVRVFRINGKEIPSHYKDTEQIKQRSLPPVAAGPQHVQVLRTLPQMNFFPSRQGTINKTFLADIPVLGQAVLGLLTCIFKLVSGYGQDEFSFAPGGIFEFRTAMRKAIAQAERYVYVEDQGFRNMELMDLLHKQLVAQPALKVIFVHGGDPADPPDTFMAHAINAHLVKDRPDLGSRIAFYEAGQTMHSKLTIIDDIWAAIGSANAFRRSMYTDGECSIAVLDEEAVTFAQKLRAALWGEHAGLTVDALAWADFLNLDSSLGLWNPAWGPPAAAQLLPRFERMEVPFVVCDHAPGTVAVTHGEEIVTGQGTAWDNGLVDRAFKVVGEDWVYCITAVDSPTQLHIKVLRDPTFAYQGSTGSGKAYLLKQPGKWLQDELPAFDGVAYAQQDADSRLDY